MEPRFTAVCDLVLKYRHSKDRLVRRTVIALLPRLASFMPNAFASGYLRDSLEHLLRALGNSNERATAFVAVGRVALAVSKVEGGIDILRPHLPHIIKQIHDGLQKRNNTFCIEALVCVSMLAHAVRSAIKDSMHDLLSSMFNAGLNPTLTEALASVVHYIPPLLPLVQERLLHELSLILAGTPFAFPGAEAPPTAPVAPVGKNRASSSAAGQLWNVLAARGTGRGSGMTDEEKSEVDHRRVQLALKTLSTFDFDGVQLLPFLRTTVAGRCVEACGCYTCVCVLCVCCVCVVWHGMACGSVGALPTGLLHIASFCACFFLFACPFLRLGRRTRARVDVCVCVCVWSPHRSCCAPPCPLPTTTGTLTTRFLPSAARPRSRAPSSSWGPAPGVPPPYWPTDRLWRWWRRCWSACSWWASPTPTPRSASACWRRWTPGLIRCWPRRTICGLCALRCTTRCLPRGRPPSPSSVDWRTGTRRTCCLRFVCFVLFCFVFWTDLLLFLDTHARACVCACV